MMRYDNMNIISVIVIWFEKYLWDQLYHVFFFGGELYHVFNFKWDVYFIKDNYAIS